TFGSNGEIVAVGLDLRPIGLTDLDASSLARVGARFDELSKQGRLTAEQRRLFDVAIDMHRDSTGKDARKLRDRIERALAGDTLPLTDEDPWAASARVELKTIAERDAWLGLLAMGGDGPKPTKKQVATAVAHVQRIGIA